MGHILHREQLVPAPRAEVFSFFKDAFNLERITPQFMKFSVTTPPPIEIRQGTIIDYDLKLYGVPFKWRSRIDEFVDNERFVDLQLKGPYSRWHHLHAFEDAPGGTKMTDTINYVVPMGLLGELAHAMIIKRSLKKIFDYRYETIAKNFSEP